MLCRRKGQAQLSSDAVQPPVVRPEVSTLRQPGGRKQMAVDVAYAPAEQRISFDEVECLSIRSHIGMWQIGESIEYQLALLQVAESKLANDKWMR